MDTAITERSYRLQEGVQRAIPSLLASSDFLGNLENSLRILGKILDVDLVFVAVARSNAGAIHPDSSPDLSTLVVLEKKNGRWRGIQHRETRKLSIHHQIGDQPAFKKDHVLSGPFTHFFTPGDLDEDLEPVQWVDLLPLWANGKLKGVLGFGVKKNCGERVFPHDISIKVFTATLANWLERYEVFKGVCRERDQLRDVLNLGGAATESNNSKPDPEHSVRDAQLLNRKIFTTIPDQVFIIDLHDHSNLYSNKATFLGYSLETIDDPFEFFQQLIHPDDLGPAFEHFFEKLSQAGDDEVIESEYRMYTKDGDLIWFSERVKVFKRDEKGQVRQYLTILQDITSRKEAVDASRQSTQQYKNFVTYSTDGIYYMNCGVPIDIQLPPEEQLKLYYEHAYIEDANPAIINMYNLEQREDLVGRKVLEMHQGEHLQENQQSFLDLIRNDYRVMAVETIEKTSDGHLRYFQNNAVGDIVNGQLVGIWGTQQDITGKRVAERAKKESDILFRTLFDKNPLGIVIGNPQGDLVRCNQRFAEMLDYDVEQLEQMTFMAITHPAEIEDEFVKVMGAANQQLPVMLMEKRYINRSGQVVWANVSMSLLYNKDGSLRLLMAMIEDITERRKIRRKLEQNEAFQKAILTTLPDLKFRINKEGVYVDHYPSPNDDQDLLLPPEKFIGKSIYDVLPDYLAEATMANLRKAIETGEMQSFEYMLPIRGNMFHFEFRVNAISEQEVIAVVRNVSERNWAQLELKNKIRELDEKNRELKDYIDSNLQLENFAYIASHDLREPLRTMGTFAQLLEKKYAEQLDDTARTYIDFVVQGSRNLNNLIEDLLVYSRIHGRDNPQEQILLPELLQEVVGGLKESIEEQDADIRISGIPEVVTANPNRLKQLFQNLLANAIKFKKRDIPVQVRVNCRDLGACWEFEIKDNGIGIEPDFHEKVFLLFKKLHSRKDFQGTGLGLAICKKVVEQMGGDIWVESLPGEGASFFFTMPK